MRDPPTKDPAAECKLTPGNLNSTLKSRIGRAGKPTEDARASVVRVVKEHPVVWATVEHLPAPDSVHRRLVAGQDCQERARVHAVASVVLWGKRSFS